MPDFRASHAVVIGIDGYQFGIPPLRTAVNDARRLAEILTRPEYGYTLHRLINEEATRAGLEQMFATTLNNEVDERDRVLVYFAGHGIACDGDDGPAGYLVPQDARCEDRDTFLPMTDLHAWLTDLPCRHLLLILDCCFAGAFRWTSARSLRPLPDVIHKERYERFLRDPAWQVLTSAAYDQTALDQLAGDDKRGAQTGQDDSGEHSPFAQALFDALAGAGDVVPKGTGDGVITATELYLYLRDAVEPRAEAQASHRQTPGLWPLKKQNKGEYILLVPGHELNLPPAPELTADNNPWRGLKSYDERHRKLFFGREDEIDALEGLVANQPFTAVLGASGTGKSSLVKAGLLPRLKEDKEAGPEWCVLEPMRPTDRPLEVLKATLAKDGISADLTSDDGLAQMVAGWNETNPKKRLVLTVDQCEELVTLCRDDAVRKHFLALLAKAVQLHPEAFRLVITLRSDFEPRLKEDKEVKKDMKDMPSGLDWQKARYVIPPMDQSDLRDVIEGPASVRVLHFEPPELVDELINEVVQTPGALPLLSFTLSELYRKYLDRQEKARLAGETVDRSLTQADYIKLERVIGSLQKRATEEYDALRDPVDQEKMKWLMLRMISTEGGDLARRRVAQRELDYPKDLRVKRVIDRLVEARLLVQGKDNSSDGTPGEPYVEPAHDALVRSWDKLQQWKAEEDMYLPLQRKLAQEAAEWEEEGKKTDYLWDDDPLLPQLEALLWPAEGEEQGLVLPDGQHPRDTVQPKRPALVSLARHLKQLRQLVLPDVKNPQNTARLNELELEFTMTSVLQRARMRRRNVGITAAVLIALATLAMFAFLQAGLARKSEATAVVEANLRATEVMVRTTAQMAEAKARQVAEARGAEAQAAAAAEAEARDLEAEARQVAQTREAEAQTAATAEAKARNLAEQRRAEAEARQLAAQTITSIDQQEPADLSLLLAVEAMRATTDHGLLSLVEADAALRRALDSAPLAVLSHVGRTVHMAFSPDDARLATVTEDGSAQVWDATTGERLVVFSTGESPEDIVFRSETVLLATKDEQGESVSLWDVRAGKLLHSLPHQDAVGAAVFHPEGTLLATPSGGMLRLWDTATGREVRAFAHDAVDTALFSADGGRLVTVGQGTARLWDVATGEKLASKALPPDETLGSAVDFAFNPEGTHLAVVGPNTGGSNALQPLMVWTVASETLLLSGGSGVRDIAFSPDGAKLAVAEGAASGSSVSIRNTTTGEDSVLARQNAYALAFSQDGALLAMGGDGICSLWTITGELAADLRPKGEVRQVAFAPNGTRLATAGDSSVWIWSSDAWGSPDVVRHHAEFKSVEFSPNGLQLVAKTNDAGSLWDLRTGEEIALLGDYPEIEFSPDSRWLSVSSSDAFRIFDTADGQERSALPHSEDLLHVFLSPDPSRLVEPHKDGTYRLIDTATGQEVSILDYGEVVSTYLPIRFSPNGAWLIAWADDVAQVWDATTGGWLASLQHDGDITQLEVSSDGQHVATRTTGSTRLWDAQTGEMLAEILQEGSGVRFSPLGRWLAIDTSAPSVALRHVATGVAEHGLAVSFAPDDSVVALLTDDHAVRLLDGPTGEGLSVLDVPDQVKVDPYSIVIGIAVGPDGRRLAVLSQEQDQVAYLWDLWSGQKLSNLVHDSSIMHLVFSPDGKWLAAASANGFSVWDADSGQQLSVVHLHLDKGWIVGLKFSSDGTWLAVSYYLGMAQGSGSSTQVYRVSADELKQLACHTVDRNLSYMEWQQYLGDREYRPTCPDLPVPLATAAP